MNDKIESTSDDRVKNNVMRHEYKILTAEEKAGMAAIKDAGLEFYGLLDNIAPAGSREISLAKTKVEEAVMWAVKHITK